MLKSFKKSVAAVCALLIMCSSSVPSFANEVIDDGRLIVVNIDGKEFVIEKGESINIPLEYTEEYKNLNSSPLATFPGDAGVLTVTPGSSSIQYKIVMSIPAARFSGKMGITNITHGGISSPNPISGFSGSVPYRALSGCRYSAVVSGSAYSLAGVKVADTVPNITVWTR